MSKQSNTKATKPVATKTVASKAAEKAWQKKHDAMLERLRNVGTAIGTQEKREKAARGEVLALVNAKLCEAMKAGLTADDLKAPTKNWPGVFFTAIVTAMEEARGAKFETKQEKGNRDNMMTRMRNFLRDRGANPLDLYGNLARTAANKSKQAPRGAQTPTSDTGKTPAELATEQNAGSTKNPAVKRGVEEKLIGLEPVAMFVKAWLEANPSVAGGDEKPINKVRDMLIDVQDELADILKQSKK